MTVKLDPAQQAIADVRAQLDEDPDVPVVTPGHIEPRAAALLAKREKLDAKEALRRVVHSLYIGGEDLGRNV
jgi:hypothetical protein